MIQKVSATLNQDAMSLITKLSPSYISNHLAHLPEVAAEFSAVKKQQLKRLKQRFIMAALVVVSGLGLFMIGQLSLAFSEKSYTYISDGVIKEGEPLMLFSQYRMDELGETADQQRARLQGNTKRFDREYLLLHKKQARHVVKDVADGKRLFELTDTNKNQDIRNDLLSILGMMVTVVGMFGFWYVFKFKD
ncbi:hypothetical protein [Marinicella rhabdoformis]|uniref:hypothetical protein n=1 Tax=Marinicella rhabdoformis TaxID=2580566 RepID=UPI0012AECA4E|nr:hypothetical protein [Marinicella rhabdoformis]